MPPRRAKSDCKDTYDDDHRHRIRDKSYSPRTKYKQAVDAAWAQYHKTADPAYYQYDQAVTDPYDTYKRTYHDAQMKFEYDTASHVRIRNETQNKAWQLYVDETAPLRHKRDDIINEAERIREKAIDDAYEKYHLTDANIIQDEADMEVN